VIALVAEPREVAAIAAALTRSPLVAFDLEFLSQDRLVPTLCLVQVAWLDPAGAGALPPAAEAEGLAARHRALDAPSGGVDAIGAPGSARPGPGAVPSLIGPADGPRDPNVALLDPLAVDVRPVVDALAAHPLAIAHAARQDLQLLAARFGASLAGVLDTQVMAAFAGLGDQVGLAALVAQLVGAVLGKEQQWTDWARRPLSPAQLTYAAADVAHLPAVYHRLAERLGARIAWARAESAVVAADAEAAARVTPDTAWEQLGGTRGLHADALGAVIALAAWRQRTAAELDRPLGHVLADRALIDLARARPLTADAVRASKQASALVRQRAGAVAAAVAAAPSAPPTSWAAWQPLTPRAQRWADGLVIIAQQVAEEAGLAARLLATRADAEALARAVDERGLAAATAFPAFATWRRELLGPCWHGWLAGRLAIVCDAASPTGLALVPRG
jgi:ribonuclease D